MKLQRRPWPARPLTLPPGHGSRLRLGAWPTDAAVGHLVVLDHDHVPTPDEIERAIERGRSHGLRALRTSALFPEAASALRSQGFVPIDTLALLRRDLRDPDTSEVPEVGEAADAAAVADLADLPRPDELPPVHRLRRHHHAAAAAADREAFGTLWGYDAAAVAEVRRATPVHHARRVGDRSRLDGYAISGAGATTGYLQRLAVRTDRRRRGLASALVADALRWMISRGVDRALVNTSVDNLAALTLYERFGFVRLPERLTVAEVSLLSADHEGRR